MPGSRRAAGEGSKPIKGKDGIYKTYISIDGKRHYVYAKAQAEVIRKRDELKRTLGQGLPLPQKRLTVAGLLDRWLNESVLPRRKPGTYHRYEYDVRQYIAPTLGRVLLAKLTQHHVQALLNAKRAAGLSPRSVQMIQGTLRTALNWAMKGDLVQRNVAKLTDPIQVRPPEIHALSPVEAQAFIAATEGDEDTALYQIALGLGLRRGETLGLSWADVNLDERTLHVHRGLVRVRGEGLNLVELKTEKSRRTLQLPDFAVAALQVHQERQRAERDAAEGRWQETDLVFTNSIGTALDPDNVTHRFQRFVKRAGLPPQRLHDLRHGYGTLSLATGEDIRVVMANMGHSQISTTMLYTHVLPSLQRTAADNMDALLGRPKASPASEGGGAGGGK